MRSNFVRKKLKAGESSVGTWLTLSSPTAAHLLARAGFDWLTVELEHTPTSFETAAINFASIAAQGTVPLCRVPWNTGENIKRVLDTGAWGVIVPMIKTRADAEAVVAAARYAPLGERSIGGQMHAATFATDPGTYYSRANEEILVILMIEHVSAIENIEAILSVPGIDAYFIGPNDLHNSLGKPPAFESDDKDFCDALERVKAAGKKFGVPSGIHVADEHAAKRRIAEGYQFVAVSSETGMMLSKAKDITTALGIGSNATVAKY
jgi:4-hydroxy-2-oxoheptanedioate aldolase